jgi:hypothetical protein
MVIIIIIIIVTSTWPRRHHTPFCANLCSEQHRQRRRTLVEDLRFKRLTDNLWDCAEEGKNSQRSLQVRLEGAKVMSDLSCAAPLFDVEENDRDKFLH